MKVTLIKVSMMEGKSYDALKPLVFAIFDAITPEDVEMRYIDDRIEDLPEVMDSDIIALSVETFAAGRAYRLARKYKTPHNHIVMGGFHPTALPEEALCYCDTVLVGDAEDTWPQFLSDYTKGQPKSRYDSTHRECLRPIQFNSPVYDGKKYLPLGLVQFSRGCKFNCDFCSVSSFYRCKVRQKPTQDIVAEIRGIREKLLFFIDDNLFLDEASALALFEAIAPLKKKWACQISMDVAANDTLLSAMKDSGCFLVLMGFESLNHENLTLMNKVANLRVSAYETAIANIYRHGLMIWGTFVLGYDHDRPEDIEATMEFAAKHGFAAGHFNPLIPLPGTKLYDRLEAEGRLLYPRWWLKEDYRYGDTVFLPGGMTPEELQSGCKNARFRFNSYSNIFKRLFSCKANRKPFNALVFLALNLVSRKEIHRKQGKALGQA